MSKSNQWMRAAIIAVLAVCSARASAQNLERLPPNAIGEVFQAYYSLDPLIFNAYFKATTWPLTSNEFGDLAFVFLEGDVGVGAIIWSNPWSASNATSSVVGAMWGNVLHRWFELTADSFFWNSYPLQSQQIIPPATVSPPHLGTRSREGGEYVRLYGEIAIFSSPTGGTRAVLGPFQDWLGLGGFNVIGWPMTEEYAPNDGRCEVRQDFTFAYACLNTFSPWRFHAPDGTPL